MKKTLLLAITIFCFSNFTNAQAGELDASFGNNGVVKTNVFNAGNTIYKKTVVQNDGKIIASGEAWNGNIFEFIIVRYNTDGSIDNTFSGDGIVSTGITTPYDESVFSVALQNDGKIVAARGDYLFRYNTDGSFDNTFADNGKQTNSIIYMNAIAIQSDGKIVVAGGQNEMNEDGGITYPAVARYNTAGILDKTFGINGRQTNKSSAGGGFSSIAVQNDGKIVVAGIIEVTPPYDGAVILSRLNTDGSIDSTFAHSGSVSPSIGANSCAVSVQSDGKIVVAGSGDDHDTGNTDISRFNSDGSIDSSFHANGSFGFYKSAQNTSIALQNDGKIVVSGIDLLRLNTDGSLDTTFNKDADKEAGFKIRDIAILNNKLYAVGGGIFGTVVRYLLSNDSSNTPPTVSLTTPADNTTRLAPAAHIRLRAVAADKDGTISKVEFYNGTTLLHTETVFPYGYVWENVGLGNYTLTAKAYDNSGLVTTSAPVHIFVVPNKPPVVSITKPVNNRSFAAPGYIHLEATASDTDGRVTNVKFYNGSTLLRTEYEFPYTYHWENVPAGTYTVTAVATDNWGAHTTSAPVTIRVTSANAMIVSNRPENGKMPVSGAVSLKLSPNPATDVVNVYTDGLQQSKPATISIISVSGIVLKTMQSSNSTTQLDVSSLVSGLYTIKIVSGDKIMYKQFVKL